MREYINGHIIILITETLEYSYAIGMKPGNNPYTVFCYDKDNKKYFSCKSCLNMIQATEFMCSLIYRDMDIDIEEKKEETSSKGLIQENSSNDSKGFLDESKILGMNKSNVVSDTKNDDDVLIPEIAFIPNEPEQVINRGPDGEDIMEWGIASGQDKENIIAKLIPINGNFFELNISGTGAIDDLYIVPWAKYRNKIISCVISDGIDRIGCRVFYDCSELSRIELPNTLIEIGNSAFSGCQKLKSITFPNGLKSIGEFAFERCYELDFYYLPSSVEEVHSFAFENGDRKIITVTGDDVNSIMTFEKQADNVEII